MSWSQEALSLSLGAKRYISSPLPLMHKTFFLFPSHTHIHTHTHTRKAFPLHVHEKALYPWHMESFWFAVQFWFKCIHFCLNLFLFFLFVFFLPNQGCLQSSNSHNLKFLMVKPWGTFSESPVMGCAVTFTQNRNRNHNINAKQTSHRSMRKDSNSNSKTLFVPTAQVKMLWLGWPFVLCLYAGNVFGPQIWAPLGDSLAGFDLEDPAKL